MNLQQLIESKKLDWVNSDITADNFPPQPISTDLKVYHFDKPMESEEVVAEMAKDGYEPANIYELLTWQNWDGKDFVAALGSVAKVCGARYVAYLNRDGSRRYLYLLGWDDDWRADCRFLAVCKDTRQLNNLETSNSDTLALKSATNNQLLAELLTRLK